MHDARLRLLLAIAASAAVHLSLIYGVAVRGPVPAGPMIVARVQGEPAVDAGLLSPANPTAPGGAAPWRTRGGTPAPPRPSATSAVGAAIAPEPAPPALPVPPPDSALPAVAMPVLGDATWYPALELDVYPRALGSVQPEYPARAAREAIGGVVTLELMLDEHGAVHEVSVVRSMPEGYFEAAAVAAFADARFEPAKKDGRSVRSRIAVRVAFEGGPQQADPAPQSRAETGAGESAAQDHDIR